MRQNVIATWDSATRGPIENWYRMDTIRYHEPFQIPTQLFLAGLALLNCQHSFTANTPSLPALLNGQHSLNCQHSFTTNTP